MKNFRFLLFAVLFSVFANAQKIGVVDTNYILSKLPQYKDAEARLDSQVKNWEKEVQTMQSDYESKKAAFENEKVLLIGDQLKQRETEIKELETKLKTLINARFGTQGEINRARANLTKPFQDQIWNAIKTVSEKNSLGIVLDKSNNISVIFLEKRYDYTDKVLDLLLKNQPSKTTPQENSRGKNNSGTPKAGAKRGQIQELKAAQDEVEAVRR